MLIDGGEGEGLDLEIQARRKAHRAQHAQVVLGEALTRGADGPDHPLPNVPAPAYVVDPPVGQRIEEHPVDGEVAPQGVLARVGELHLVRMAAVEVGSVAAKPGHLVAPALQHHHHDPELRSNGNGVPEEAHDLPGTGAGGHVPVRRRPSNGQVAHAAAGQQSLVPILPQGADDMEGTRIDHAPIES